MNQGSGEFLVHFVTCSVTFQSFSLQKYTLVFVPQSSTLFFGGQYFAIFTNFLITNYYYL